MRFFRQFFYGLSTVFSSFRLVGRRVYAIILTLCAIVFALGVLLGSSLSDFAYEWMVGALLAVDLPDFFQGILPWFVGWMGRIAAWLCSLLLVGVIGGSLILLLLSPLLSHVADNAWVTAGRPRPSDSFKDVAMSVMRGIAVAVRCLFLQLFCAVLVLLFYLLPFIGFLAPVLSLLVASFFYGQSLMDYAVERAEQNGVILAGKSGAFPFNNIGLTVGVGFLFALVTLIPFVGGYLALFVAPATAYAGGLVLGRAR